MSLWVDKYRPTSLGKLDYHKDQASQLKNLVQCGDFPHLLVYGPSGAGKKTRIMCLLRELYGAGVEKLRIEHQSIIAPSKKKIEISTIASNYHLEVNPSDAGNSDLVVIQELLKTVAQSQQIQSSTQRDFKVCVMLPLLCFSVQAPSKKKIEISTIASNYHLEVNPSEATRPIMPEDNTDLNGSTADLQASYQPQASLVCTVLSSVCRKEGLTLPGELAKIIAEKSGRNLRKALLMCEACRVQQNRSSLLFQGLLSELLSNCDGQLKAEVAQMAAYYEHRLQLGNKAIYHLEAFVAKFMAIYKKFMEDGLEAMMF
ncbi:UNVERIFIED_CONTAM: hypothetical protein FKN15_045370 [Acipenser sinensis]